MDTKMISTGIPYSTLPASYVRPESERPNLSAVKDCEDVPIIDLGSGDKSAIIQQILHALTILLRVAGLQVLKDGKWMAVKPHHNNFGFELPEGCVAWVLALTSPKDACRLSLVSSNFKSAADSDPVWERLLPSDYEYILARADSFPRRAPKKQLYLWLTDHPLLIDHGTKSFSLEKSSGRKCYMLAARGLYIAWGDTPRYWRWTAALPDCRFSEAAELVTVCWLEIRGQISTSMLSQNTTYAAFLVFRLTENAHGFGYRPAEVAIGVSGDEHETQTVYLDPRGGQSPGNQTVPTPNARGDGWMEIELGEYLNEEGEEREIEMSVKEVKQRNWKSGLIIQGIDIRPKVDN